MGDIAKIEGHINAFEGYGSDCASSEGVLAFLDLLLGVLEKSRLQASNGQD